MIRSKSSLDGKKRFVDWLYSVEVMDLPEFHDCTKVYHNWFHEILGSMDVPGLTAALKAAATKRRF